MNAVKTIVEMNGLVRRGRWQEPRVWMKRWDVRWLPGKPSNARGDARPIRLHLDRNGAEWTPGGIHWSSCLWIIRAESIGDNASPCLKSLWHPRIQLYISAACKILCFSNCILTATLFQTSGTIVIFVCLDDLGWFDLICFGWFAWSVNDHQHCWVNRADQ